MPTALAPASASASASDQHALVRPLHLAGPGNEDFTFELGARFGWFRPEEAAPDVVLASPCERLTLTRQQETGRWQVSTPDTSFARTGWSVAFDAYAPTEITAGVLYTLANSLTQAPALVLDDAPSSDAAFAILLSAGWGPQQRDGHQVALAPDRLAALARPLYTDNPDTVLTGAANHGTWNVAFSSQTPALLPQSAATALLRPALRRPSELPSAYRHRLTLDSLAEPTGRVEQLEPASPAARSAAARSRTVTGAPAATPVLSTPAPTITAGHARTR